MTHFNILVAEDFPAFREVARRELQRRPEFRVTTVSDGLAAVQKAAELRPDLILLDIGLPAMNGLAAAQRIRSVSPDSPILFLTRESGSDIVDEALRLGSHGLIDKTRAAYLLPAVEAILDGCPGVEHELTTGAPRGRHYQSHQAHFCSDEATFLDTVERFLGSALAAHDAAIALVTPSHLRQLLPRLKMYGNVDEAIAQGWFVHLDANELVSRILSEGVASCRPALITTIESAAAAARRPHPLVACIGECAGILCAAGHVDTAMALERVGVELVNTMPIDIMCTYPLLPLNHDAGFKPVCAHHGAVVVR